MLGYIFVTWLVGFSIVMLACSGWMYSAYKESFRDGILITLFASIIGAVFIPLSIFGLFITVFGKDKQ
ncbi:membrane protein [Streptomyces phage Karp]|nr:membrane protein [Streptomyces phage Karp]